MGFEKNDPVLAHPVVATAQTGSVSVILRSLCPEEFGIISFWVTNLLNLPQALSASDYYLGYLGNLRELLVHYRRATLRRVADIDMALWSAAHFSQDADLGSDFEAIKRARVEMWQAEKFHELRFRNLLSGLKRDKIMHPQKSIQLAFASALLEHDYALASAVAAKVYESLISEIGNDLKLPPARGWERSMRGLVHYVEEKGIETRIGIGRGRLRELLGLRNRAVHEDAPPYRPLTRSDAQAFAQGVSELLSAWNNRPIRN